MSDDRDFNYSHIGCQFCKSHDGFIHRFNSVSGAEFAHVDCFNKYHTEMAIKRIRAREEAERG